MEERWRSLLEEAQTNAEEDEIPEGAGSLEDWQERWGVSPNTARLYLRNLIAKGRMKQSALKRRASDGRMRRIKYYIEVEAD